MPQISIMSKNLLIIRIIILLENINNRKNIKNFKDFKPHGIFNLAAETHVDRSIDGPRSFFIQIPWEFLIY